MSGCKAEDILLSTAAPNLFSARDRFCGEWFFRRSGSMVLCAAWMLYIARPSSWQVADQCWSAALGLGTPGLGNKGKKERQLNISLNEKNTACVTLDFIQVLYNASNFIYGLRAQKQVTNII